MAKKQEELNNNNKVNRKIKRKKTVVLQWQQTHLIISICPSSSFV